MDDRDRRHLLDLVVHGRTAIAYAGVRGRGWWENPETVDAVLMRVCQVGEAARKTSPEALTEAPGVAWRDVKGMRTMIVHDYRAIDVEILREVVDHRLPSLISAVQRALSADEKRDRPGH